MADNFQKDKRKYDFCQCNQSGEFITARIRESNTAAGIIWGSE